MIRKGIQNKLLERMQCMLACVCISSTTIALSRESSLDIQLLRGWLEVEEVPEDDELSDADTDHHEQVDDAPAVNHLCIDKANRLGNDIHI